MDLWHTVGSVDVTTDDLGLWPSWAGKVLVYAIFGVGVILTIVVNRLFPERRRQIEIASVALGIVFLIATAVMFNSGEDFLREYGWLAVTTLCVGVAFLGHPYLVRNFNQ